MEAAEATLKTLAVPAVFAYAGVRASTLLGSTSTIIQLLGGVMGAGFGIWLASKV